MQKAMPGAFSLRAKIKLPIAVLLAGGRFGVGAGYRGALLAVMLLGGLHLRSGLGAGRGCGRSRCLGRKNGAHAQQRGENKFVHVDSPFARGSFPPRITILQPDAKINDSLRRGVPDTNLRGKGRADLNE